VLGLWCADGTSSAQLTLPVRSLHLQKVQGEDARTMPHPLGKPSLCRASGSWRSSASTREGIMVADRARQQCLPSIGTRKRACRFEGRRPASVPLRFLLSTRLLHMKHDAVDRLMRDTILICNCTKWFVVLHHTMNNHRPVFSGKSIVRVFRPWSPFVNHRRWAGVRCFIVSKQVLRLELQVARWRKEEGKNW
jgi:hypothetical protein